MGVAASLLPTQTANIGFGRSPRLRCDCATAATDFAAASRRSERGRNIHDKNGVVLRIFEQPLQRSGVTGGVGVAGNVDRVGA